MYMNKYMNIQYDIDREIREEIERERKAQELLFKELKVFSNDNNSNKSTKGGPSNTHRNVGARK
jgi:hypothetical protein